MHGELVSRSTDREPLLESLKRQKAQLQDKLKDVDEAIKSLEENPEFVKMINSLSKVTRLYYDLPF